MLPWIDIQGFNYTYPGGEAPVLNNINLSIEKGAFVVIAGPSGCGKSTLGKALAGFLFQDEVPNYKGKIIVNHIDMSQIPLFHASERVAYVQQNPEDQFCTLSVLDEIAFGLENRCLQPELIERRIDETLKIVNGLELKGRLLAELSGGEKQKVAIATMIALSPDVLILDEPTSNLDPNATQNVFETLHALRKLKDLTVIIIEHKLSQLLPFDPDLVLMAEGKIISERRLSGYIPHQDFKRVAKDFQQHRSVRSNQPLLDISHLYVRLGGQEILHDICMSFYPGEFVALMGPNGSGKSTLLNTIMGFHRPESGQLMGFGKDLFQAKTSALVEDIGFIFQNPDHQLFTQSVWDEATLTIKNLHLLDKEHVAKAKSFLKETGLAERFDDHPQQLSYGEKRRLNLIAVILHNPKLLLVDEFLIGQDMHNAHKWMYTLRSYAAEGHTILFVNHHADLTLAYCERLIFLDAGRKIIDAQVTTAFDKLAKIGFRSFLPRGQEGPVYA